MRTCHHAFRVALGAALLSAACSDSPRQAAEPGTAMAELRPAELGRFQFGEAVFNRVFLPEEGLGPFFNENQCSACHTSPASGGTGEQLVLRATLFEAPDRCERFSAESGENLRRRSTPLLAAHGVERVERPGGATAVGRFTVPFLFGLGLVEAIPEEAILARADPDDADGDGISGRPGRDAHGRLARFGRKADVATLDDFVTDALRFEMGLTTDAYPHEAGLAAAPFPPGTDPAADPEVGAREAAALVDYLRFLAPPARRVPAEAAERALDERGEKLFHGIGCAACHVPSMRTGRNPVPALDRERVALYSDLLLHDMGPALADVCSGAAGPSELRTEMLMGLGWREIFLHDGRAKSVRDAILFHGGEAARASAAFQALPVRDQEALLRFLSGL